MKLLNKKAPLFFIGRDTRISGQMLEFKIAVEICLVGGDAVLSGVLLMAAIVYFS